MEIVSELMNYQLSLFCIPVAIVIVGILVFTFGFKSAEQPPFDKLTIEDRKPANKKRKTKEKKTIANGFVSIGDSVKSDKSPSKESKRLVKEVDTHKSKKGENNKEVEKIKKVEKVKVFEETKNKKNKKNDNEKPADFDDGNWEIVPTKADKKKKQEQSPVKKEKKVKKADKPTEIEKLVKEVINKELKEKERETALEKENTDNLNVNNELLNVEEHKEKKKEKKPKKENEKVEKLADETASETEVPPSKDIKKNVENENKSDIAEEQKQAGTVAFDELGDIWTEAKVQKKAKKKARRDN